MGSNCQTTLTGDQVIEESEGSLMSERPFLFSQAIDSGTVNKQTFEAAHAHVLSLMETESLVPFLTSNLYSTVRERIAGGEMETLIQEDMENATDIMSKEARKYIFCIFIHFPFYLSCLLVGARVPGPFAIPRSDTIPKQSTALRAWVKELRRSHRKPVARVALQQ